MWDKWFDEQGQMRNTSPYNRCDDDGDLNADFDMGLIYDIPDSDPDK